METRRWLPARRMWFQQDRWWQYPNLH